MRGQYKALFATLALFLLAHSAAAQPAATLAPPVISTVTPGNTNAIIGFIPPRVPNGNPQIREYVVSCSIPGNAAAGTLEVTADVQGIVGNSIPIEGLTNGQQYVCSMIARSVTGGIIPRAIDSQPSNSTPAFTPTATGSPTIFLTAPSSEGPAPTQESSKPPTPEKPTRALPEAPVTTDVVVGPSEVTIKFDPVVVSKDGEPITGYTASCQSNIDVSASNSKAASAPVNVPSNATEVVIKGLAPGEYTCSLAADTAAGAGRAITEVVTIRGSPAPEATVEEPIIVPVPTQAPAPVAVPVLVPASAPTTAPPAPVSSAHRAVAIGTAIVALALGLLF